VKAVILAAGQGLRLLRGDLLGPPKCLLRFADRSLIERHLVLLREVGVADVTITVGYRQEQVALELGDLGLVPPPRTVYNKAYRQGSLSSLEVVRDVLTSGDDVLLMDADVLYDRRVLAALTAGPAENRLLVDFGFEPGDEPVKVCLRNGRPVELRKNVTPGLEYEQIGESVGFFRLTAPTAAALAAVTDSFAQSGRADLPHEEAVREVMLSSPFAYADVTGLPWTEIDFPQDLVRAHQQILPKLEELLV
jgi:choline kinase